MSYDFSEVGCSGFWGYLAGSLVGYLEGSLAGSGFYVS